MKKFLKVVLYCLLFAFILAFASIAIEDQDGILIGLLLVLLILFIIVCISNIRNRSKIKKLLNQMKQDKASYESSMQIEKESYESRINDLRNLIQEKKISEDSLQRVKDEINDHETKLSVIEGKISKQEKTLQNQINKLTKARELYDAMDRAVNSYYSSSEFIPLTFEQKSGLDLIAPTALLDLKCYNFKDLKKKFDENEDKVRELLENFLEANSSKQYKMVYQVMVISLSAELQNILTKMKYGKLEDARADVKIMIAKYVNIVSDGAQGVSATVKKFIFALEGLYLNAVNIEYEYYIKKEQARQEQLEIKAQMKAEREEQRRLKEEEEKIKKEIEKYNNEKERLQNMLEEATTEEEKASIEQSIGNIDLQISDIDEKYEEIVNLQNGKAGYVYIISNIGSFGEDIFKVGMTRRLEPQERVDELGSASVPFGFDVHSFIFSDNAPELETELHNRLNDKRVNKVNLRKEFFNVSLDDMEALVYNVDPNAEFNRTILATEFRQSQSMS